jgi:hypothetical protein
MWSNDALMRDGGKFVVMNRDSSQRRYPLETNAPSFEFIENYIA